ncbi:MAG: hypothetical protein RIG62_25185 [Cyclobacteriaceae bacterium]
MIELIEKNFAAVIGVTGTLLGVLLGSFINWISRIGRIKIFQNSIVIDLLERDGYGGFKRVQGITAETEALDIKIDIDILNTSEYSRKSMRNLGLLIKQRNKEKIYTVTDKSTARLSGPIRLVDELKIINLNPREIKNFSIGVYIKEDIEQVLESNWYLQYTSISDRTRRVKINMKK